MTRPPESAAPIIAAGLAYWSDWIKPFNRVPTPLFFSKHPLILHAATLGAALKETRQATAELTLAVFPLLEYSGLWPAWRPLLESFPDYFDQFDLPTQAYLWNRLGQIYRLSAEFSQATAVREQALAIAEQLPDEKILHHAIHFQLSEDYRVAGRYAQAREHALEAQRIAAHIPEIEIGFASACNTLGLIALEIRQLDEAVQWFRSAISVWEKHKQPVELARTLSGLAYILLNQGKFDKAIAAYQQSLAESAKGGSLIDTVRAKYSMGVAYMQREQFDRAETMFRSAGADLQRQMWQYPLLWVQTVNNIGYVIVRQGRYGEAESFLRQGVALWRQIGDALGEANCLESLAESLCGQDRKAEGGALYREALRLVMNEREKPGAAGLYQTIYKEYAAHCPDMIDNELPEQL